MPKHPALARFTAAAIRNTFALLAALLICTQTAAGQSPTPATTPILTLDQIRPGMTGYGLTVFHGTTIEPFDVRVVSVMHDFGPKRGVVWIRCTDPRMQKLGPVQGMSGSPIYLWTDEDTDRQPGRGGRLIGAFAFGYGATKDCYVGVQPITLMRQAAGRATPNTGGAHHPLPQTPGLPTGRPARTAQHRLPTNPHPGKPMAIRRPPQGPHRPRDTTHTKHHPTPTVPTPFSTTAARLALPLNVPWPDVAAALEPLLRAQGFAPTATPTAPANAPAGNPPKDYDLQSIDFAPGGVLSIPLGFGDLDITAVGTITEVLPDGTVLGFGHSMFGTGESALPMATGYVHMVLPSIISSFKLGGSGVIRGAVVQDENSAVVCIPEPRFKTAPVSVQVDMPPQPTARYNYQVTSAPSHGPPGHRLARRPEHRAPSATSPPWPHSDSEATSPSTTENRSPSTRSWSTPPGSTSSSRSSSCSPPSRTTHTSP